MNKSNKQEWKKRDPDGATPYMTFEEQRFRRPVLYTLSERLNAISWPAPAS
ncbi:hypothetical protein AB4Z48_29100 [Cupriavidus sp. 2TAF22]|uniref:hypothetical protein n=1 Tax=unclassified Cupriavidus TaxID=2640874 RepID=UPI003F91433E